MLSTTDSAHCDSHPASAALGGKALTRKQSPLFSTCTTGIPRAAGHAGLAAPRNEKMVQGHLV